MSRVMRMLVLFDLPTGTPEERHNYTLFRKFLIHEGFDMLQYSVYCRITANHDDSRKYLQRIKANLPPRGSVRLLLITEKQYAAMQIFLGNKTATENLLKDNDIVEL